MGRRRDDLINGMRSFPYQAYIIFYRITDTTVQIVRVLHGARDIGTTLF